MAVRCAVELAAARMRNRVMRFLIAYGSRRCEPYILNGQQLRFRKPQRDFVATHLNLNGVAHRRPLNELHNRARRKAHIEQMMPQCPRAADLCYRRGLTRLKCV